LVNSVGVIFSVVVAILHPAFELAVPVVSPVRVTDYADANLVAVAELPVHVVAVVALPEIEISHVPLAPVPSANGKVPLYKRVPLELYILKYGPFFAVYSSFPHILIFSFPLPYSHTISPESLEDVPDVPSCISVPAVNNVPVNVPPDNGRAYVNIVDKSYVYSLVPLSLNHHFGLSSVEPATEPPPNDTHGVL